jgi:hypothetical protein
LFLLHLSRPTTRHDTTTERGEKRRKKTYIWGEESGKRVLNVSQPLEVNNMSSPTRLGPPQQTMKRAEQKKRRKEENLGFFLLFLFPQKST